MSIFVPRMFVPRMFVPRIQKFFLGWWRRVYSQQQAVNEVDRRVDRTEGEARREEVKRERKGMIGTRRETSHITAHSKQFLLLPPFLQQASPQKRRVNMQQC